MNKANGTLNGFRTSATMFKQISGDLMRQSILNLADADKEISKADTRQQQAARDRRQQQRNPRRLCRTGRQAERGAASRRCSSRSTCTARKSAGCRASRRTIRSSPNCPAMAQPVLDRLAENATKLMEISVQQGCGIRRRRQADRRHLEPAGRSSPKPRSRVPAPSASRPIRSRSAPWCSAS